MLISAVVAHEGGPPTMQLEVGQVGVYVIKSDVSSEGDLSFYLAHAGFDTNVVRVTPEGTFSSRGDGRFQITGVAPGKTILTLGWLYPPNDAGGLFTLEVTVTAPATKPPTAANATSSATSLDPVNLFTGELTMMEPPDLDLGGPMPLYFARYYSSGLSRDSLMHSPLGDNWSSNFDWHLLRDGNNITVVSWEGRRISFARNANGWQLAGLADVPFQLLESGEDFVLGDPRDNRLFTFNSSGDLTSISDSHGNVHTLRYESGRLAEVSDGLGRVLSFTSSGFQQLTAVSDGTRRVTLGYTNIVVVGTDNSGFKLFDNYRALSSVSSPLGNVTRYVYDGNGTSNHIRGLLLSKVRPMGNTPYSQTWNGHGQVATQTESGINTHSFSYHGATTVMTNPLGRTRSVVHTAGGQLASFTDEAGATIAIQSNPNGQRIGVTDRKGGKTSFEYHAPSGKVAAITHPDGTTFRFEFAERISKGIRLYDPSRVIYPDGATEEYTYDANGNVTALKDRAGAIWSLTYNDRGQVLAVSNPIGGVATFTYHPDGTLASRSDSDTGVTQFKYDGLRRMIEAVRPDGSTVQTAYDDQDRIGSITDERGNSYQYRYDANDNLIATVDPDGQSTRFEYDRRDRLHRVIDRLRNVTTTGYDALEKLSEIVNRNGNRVALAYDALQRLSALTDPAGQRWTFAYDPEGILTQWANPRNETQTQESDSMGFPAAYLDAMGRKRSLSRNHLKLVTKVVDELGRTTSRSFDPRGLVATVTKPVIGSAQYVRNQAGQVTRIDDPTGHQWSRQYTPMGRLRSETDPLGRATTYEYDSRGRLASTRFADGTTRATSYDARNNPVLARFTDSTELRFEHDGLNRLVRANDLELAYDPESRITNTVSSTIAFGAQYDAGGRLVRAGYADNLFQVSYEYDQRDRLIRVSDSFSGASVEFTYDEAGRMTRHSRANGVSGLYSYDPVGRLTRIQEGHFLDLSYSLDAAGQVTRVNVQAPLDPASLMRPQQLDWEVDAARQIRSPGYRYDSRGRMTAAPGHTYSYDGASRMIRVGDVNLAYNGLDDLVRRTENGNTTRFYYNYALGMGPIVAERNGATGPWIRYYVWSPGGRLLYLIDAASQKAIHFHFDRVGSTMALTDENGQVTDAYAYAPYGQLLDHSGNNQQPFTFVGRYGVRQEGPDLYQMRARYYSPGSGSFLTPDPLPRRWDDIHSLNPYHYAAADPLRSVDPEGLDRTVWFFGHAWIEVDVYDAQGNVTGRVALNFAPESGKSDYQVMHPRHIVYPQWLGYDIKSSQFEDELLVREWRRLQRDPNRGQQWNPLQNCVWRSLEYAHGEIPVTLVEAEKLLGKMPVRTDVTITAAPPGPWYRQAYHWVSDSWGEFEDWLEDALE